VAAEVAAQERGGVLLLQARCGLAAVPGEGMGGDGEVIRLVHVFDPIPPFRRLARVSRENQELHDLNGLTVAQDHENARAVISSSQMLSKVPAHRRLVKANQDALLALGPTEYCRIV